MRRGHQSFGLSRAGEVIGMYDLGAQVRCHNFGQSGFTRAAVAVDSEEPRRTDRRWARMKNRGDRPSHV